MENNEKILGEVKVKDLTLDPDPFIRQKQLEAVQEFLLAEGRNNEDVNSELVRLKQGS